MTFSKKVNKAQVIGERITLARKDHRPYLTQEQLSEKAGIGRSRLAQYEAGRSIPPENVLTRLAEALGCQKAWLSGEGESPDPRHVAEVRQVYALQERKDSIPYWGSCPAGEFEMPTDEFEWVSVAREFADPDRFVAFRVVGDSMSPTFLPGDLIIVKRTKNPVPGRAVIVMWDGGLCFKRLHQTRSGPTLKADNPDYPDIEARDGIEYLGEVVSIRRDTL